MSRIMKDSGIAWIGEIPNHWSVDKTKFHLQTHEYKGFPNATVLSLYRDLGIVPKDSRDDNHNVTSEDTSKYKHVNIGDFVVNKMKAWQGSVAVSNYEGIVSPAYYVYRFFSNAFYKEYFNFLLRDKSYTPEFRRLSGGIREGQWDLSREGFRNIPVIIPPIEEQKAIADFLDKKTAEIDAAITEAKDLIDKYKAYKQSIITEAVTKGLNPDVEMKDSGIEWIGMIPESWSIKRLGVFYTLRSEKVSDKDFSPLSVTKKGIVPQLETAAKSDDGDNRKLVKKGDFVINSRSDRRGSCGISKYDGSVSLINLVLCPRGEMHAEFYNWLFHTSQFADEFYKWGHGIVDDLWTTRWSEMKNICVVLPSYEEQQSIATYLDNKCGMIDAAISQKENLVLQLQEYKKSIIFEYVTGKKEVPNG